MWGTAAVSLTRNDRAILITYRVFGAALLYGLVLVPAGRPALSDTATDLIGELRVHSVSASAASIGTCSKVQLIVENDSRDDIQILGVFSDLAESGHLLANIGGRRPARLESFGVPAGQSAEFTRSRWFELCGLRRSLASGEVFAAELRTPRWTKALTIHVH